MNKFGPLLRVARVRTGKSLREVGEYLEITPQYLHDIEQGRRGPLDRDKLVKAARLLMVEPLGLIKAAGIDRGFFKLPYSDATADLGASIEKHWPGLTKMEAAKIASFMKKKEGKK